MSEQVEAVVENPVKRMRLRYAGTCVRCGAVLEAKDWAFYDRSTKTVHCVECPDRRPAGRTAGGAHRRGLPRSARLLLLRLRPLDAPSLPPEAQVPRGVRQRSDEVTPGLRQVHDDPAS